MLSAIAELKAQHVDRAHLWINDQPVTVSCGSTFSYAGWTSGGLETFARKLSENGIAVVFTLSPAVPTKSYLASLADPWSVAKRAGADIEYDMEGQWTRRWGPQNCGANGAHPDLAAFERELVSATREAVPAVKIGISTTPAHFKDHAVLLGLADWVAPQLYELPSARIDAYADALERDYRVQAIWLGVRVDTNLETLIPNLNGEIRRARSDPKVKGIVIWGRSELTFAEKWLRRND